MTVLEQHTMELQNEVNRTLENKLKDFTLRDYFAASVMAVFAGGSYNGTPVNMCDEDKYDMVNKLARNAYKVADAMLEARRN